MPANLGRQEFDFQWGLLDESYVLTLSIQGHDWGSWMSQREQLVSSPLPCNATFLTQSMRIRITGRNQFRCCQSIAQSYDFLFSLEDISKQNKTILQEDKFRGSGPVRPLLWFWISVWGGGCLSILCIWSIGIIRSIIHASLPYKCNWIWSWIVINM